MSADEPKKPVDTSGKPESPEQAPAAAKTPDKPAAKPEAAKSEAGEGKKAASQAPNAPQEPTAPQASAAPKPAGKPAIAEPAANSDAADNGQSAGEATEAAASEALVEPVPAPKPKDKMRPVRIWLWLLALMVFAMVVVGGATRLTEAGLSITEWKPVTGVLPPLSDAQWTETFNKYKQIPQFKEMFSTMTMAQYKVIYFWEWGHRLLGRLLGLVFLLPFLYFLFTRRISLSLFWKLSVVFALGALQGLIGWWMVKSGLAGRTEVAAERLAIHLSLAAITFVALIWLAMGLRKKAAQPAEWVIRGEANGLIIAILIQIGLGALVAGARAGLTYNTWPLMDGHLVPSVAKLTSMKPLWLNFLENPTMLQFQHRMFAYLLVLMVIGHAFKAMQNRAGSSIVRRAWTLSGLVLLQAALGIFTLLHVLPAGKIPIFLALAHQAVAFLLLAMAVVHRAAMTKSAASGVTLGETNEQNGASQPHSGDTAIAT